MYEPYVNPNPPHERQTTLPENLDSFDSPKAFFQLFFSDPDFESLACNTNMYAENMHAGAAGQRP